MKKFAFFLFAAVCLVFGSVSVYAAGIRDTPEQELVGELVLLHTNDHHGVTLSHNGQGGLAERAAYIKAVRGLKPHVLLLDAGDINTGSALSNMFDAEPDILSYNLMGYDAVTFGNHEFDGEPAKLYRQIVHASFPFVCSNIKTRDGWFLGGHQYIVRKYPNFSVGIFGITTLRTEIIANPDPELIFINEIDAAREAVDILVNREKVDVVIGLTHMGNVKESEGHITSTELARAVPGIDIIVDGHSHTFMEKPLREGSAWIVSAHEWGKHIGQGTLKIARNRLVDFAWKPVAIGPDPEISALLKPYVDKANASLKEVVGRAAETFIFGNRLPRYGETALGNLICDANVWFFRDMQNQQLDFAFQNGGNIRAELPQGDITREHILTILPFENYLYIVSLKGSEIIELFDFFAAIPQGSGGFPQFSRDVRFTMDKTSGSGVVAELSIGGAPIDPERVYRFCTNDYILGGGDGYAVLRKAQEPFNTSLLLSHVVIEYIRFQKEPLIPLTDGRLLVID